MMINAQDHEYIFGSRTIAFNTNTRDRCIEGRSNPYKLHLYALDGHVAWFLRDSFAWASYKIALRSFSVEERCIRTKKNLVRANFVQKWIIELITDFVLIVNSRLIRYKHNVTRFRDRERRLSPVSMKQLLCYRTQYYLGFTWRRGKARSN